MEDIDRAIVAAIAKTEGDLGPAIMAQYDQTSVTARKFSGSGFFTSFVVKPGVSLVPITRNPLGRPLLIEFENLKNGAGAILWLKEGVLHELEVFTYTDPLPEHLVLTSISA